MGMNSHPRSSSSSSSSVGTDALEPADALCHIVPRDFAENRARLGRENFTHVLNCAHSSRRGNDFYSGMGITYLGIEAHDSPAYDMSVNFNTGAEFIHNALRTGGKILVHCHVGVSRSASIVLAYLMLKHNMTLVEAINTVKKGRGIIPNRGFLRQLIDLHVKLYGYRS